MRPAASDPEPPSPSADADVSVLVVDDHPAFRLGVVSLIRKLTGLRVCAEAADSDGAMEAFREHHPRMVVMDICLPGGDGIDLARRMRREDPHVAIMILSLHDEPLYAVRALRAGAKGYVRKDEGLPELALALYKIARNGLYVSKRFRNHLLLEAMQRTDRPAEGFLEALSPREIQVFKCLGRGLSSHEIAAELKLGPKTVETHRANIKKKLCLANAGETAQLAMEWHAMETEGPARHREPPVGFIVPPPLDPAEAPPVKAGQTTP